MAKRELTEQEIEFLRANFGTLTNRDIATRLGIHIMQVIGQARRLKLITDKPHKKRQKTTAVEPEYTVMDGVHNCYEALIPLAPSEQIRALNATIQLLGVAKTGPQPAAKTGN